MKTVADLKRYLVTGAKAKLVWSKFGHKFSGIVREVGKVQSNGIYFISPDKPSSNGSFLDFPKAKEFVGTENGFSIYEDGEKLIEYEIIKGA